MSRGKYFRYGILLVILCGTIAPERIGAAQEITAEGNAVLLVRPTELWLIWDSDRSDGRIDDFFSLQTLSSSPSTTGLFRWIPQASLVWEGNLLSVIGVMNNRMKLFLQERIGESPGSPDDRSAAAPAAVLGSGSVGKVIHCTGAAVSDLQDLLSRLDAPGAESDPEVHEQLKAWQRRMFVDVWPAAELGRCEAVCSPSTQAQCRVDQ